MQWPLAALVVLAGCLVAGRSEAETLKRAQVLAEAASVNEDALIAQTRVAESRALRRGALAGLLPQLTVAGSGTWNHEEVVFDNRVVSPQWDWGASATVSVTLFDGPLYPAYSRTRSLVDAARAEAAWAAHLLRWEAELGYETLAAAQAEVALAGRERARARRRRRARSRFRPRGAAARPRRRATSGSRGRRPARPAGARAGDRAGRGGHERAPFAAPGAR